MEISKEELKLRLHAIRVRQVMLRNIAEILADKLEIRLYGLREARPKSFEKVEGWSLRLKKARLKQSNEEVRFIEWEYLEYLQDQRWEEFWYNESIDGVRVVNGRYDSISRALTRE